MGDGGGGLGGAWGGGVREGRLGASGGAIWGGTCPQGQALVNGGVCAQRRYSAHSAGTAHT